MVLGVFTIWMFLFDKHDVFTQFKLERTMRKMVQDTFYYHNKLNEVRQERLDMENNKEKFAREHYFMKTKDEDIFVIEKRK